VHVNDLAGVFEGTLNNIPSDDDDETLSAVSCNDCTINDVAEGDRDAAPLNMVLREEVDEVIAAESEQDGADGRRKYNLRRSPKKVSIAVYVQC